MTTRSTTRATTRSTTRGINAIDFGASAPLTDPTDDPPDGFSYLVDSDGAYLADRGGAWLIDEATPIVPGPETISDLALWLRGDDIAGINGAAISSWVSREGSSFDFAQATGAKQPTLSLTSLINGMPAASFDGGDILRCATAVSSANEGTLIFVCRRSVARSYQAIFTQDNQAAAAYLTAYCQYAAETLGFDNPATAAIGAEATAVDSNDCVMFHSDGSAITSERNSVAQTVTDGTGGKWFADFTTAHASIGGIAYSSDLYFFSGLIAEIIVYDHKLTAGELTTIRAYILDRYSI